MPQSGPDDGFLPRGSQFSESTVAILRSRAREGAMSRINANPLQGLRMLIAEDNFLIGEAMREILIDLECSVVGPIDDLDEVLSAIHASDIEGALLDVQLGEANILPAASELAARGIPFILTTGRGSLADLPALLANAPLLTKPFDARRLETMMMSDAFLARIGEARRRH